MHAKASIGERRIEQKTSRELRSSKNTSKEAVHEGRMIKNDLMKRKEKTNKR
jgi:hypothetical protein